VLVGGFVVRAVVVGGLLVPSLLVRGHLVLGFLVRMVLGPVVLGLGGHGGAVGVPLRGVVRAGVEGLAAPFPLLGGAGGGLLGLELGVRAPLAADVGAGGRRGDRRRGRVVGAAVVGGVLLGRVRVVVRRLVAAGLPVRGVVRAGRVALAREVAEEGVALE